MRSYAVVRVAWDEEVKVWYVEDTDIPGLATEADTLEQLRAKVPVIVRDLMEDRPDAPAEIAIDIIARSLPCMQKVTMTHCIAGT